MDKKIFVELFRFNHKTDYLPYYRKFEFLISEGEKVSDLLSKLNDKEKFSFEGTEDYGVKINSLFVSVEELISNIVDASSDTLVIEPVSTYRAINDLSIKNDDFFSKLDILDKYLSDEQKEAYAKELQLDYYASNTLNFNKDYMGDHVMAAAGDIIASDESLKDEIISLIDDNTCGVRYFTNSEKRVLKDNTNTILKIKKLLQEVTKSELETKIEDILSVDNVAQEFVDFNIAVYDSNDTKPLEDIVVSSKAKYIDIPSKSDDLAFSSVEADERFSYKIAGNVLLDAKDNNADFLVVNCQKSFELFDNKQKEITCTVGRDIDMPIVTLDQFNDLLRGEKDPAKLGFDNHKVNISFI